MRTVLDTHILLWKYEGKQRLSKEQEELFRNTEPKSPLIVAAISLWEIAMLHNLGRIQLKIPLREWLERAVAPPLVQVVDLSPAIATEVSTLPDWFHRDPADRILIATARVLGANLATQDQRILSSGLVKTI